MIEKHPVTVPLYSIGIPAWIGLAAAGPFGCVFIGVIAALVVMVAWE